MLATAAVQLNVFQKIDHSRPAGQRIESRSPPATTIWFSRKMHGETKDLNKQRHQRRMKD